MSVPEASADDVLRAVGLLTLGADPPVEAVETALRKLGDAARGTDALRREALRAGAVRVLKPLGWRAAAVDAVLGSEPVEVTDRQGRRVMLDDGDPWSAPVDGAALLGELVETYARYIAELPPAAVAEALWTVHAHAHDATHISPLLAFTSATKRCGKSTALALVGAMVPRPLPASNITAAALFRAVERLRPTLLVDEVDSFLREREELRGVLNSGHCRAVAAVVRTVGDDHEARVFSTWAPKAIAAIGQLPDTVGDRSVEVRLNRRRRDETVERLRLDRLHADLEPLRRRCARWAADHLPALRDADPDVPSELHDRAQDNWRPLLAIADAAGGPWPERARQAALVLSGAVEDDGDVRVLLLGDLRCVMGEQEQMTSKAIVERLKDMEDRPWPEWRRGQPLTPRGLARLLEPYGVRPRQLWDSAVGKIRGYRREDLAEVWSRYLPPDPPAEAVGPVGAGQDTDFQPAADTVGAATATGGTQDGKPLHAVALPLLPDGDPPAEADYEALERAALQTEAGR